MDNTPALPFDLPLCQEPAPVETNWRRWRHPVVRDLAWVLASPPLLQPRGSGIHWPDAAWITDCP